MVEKVNGNSEADGLPETVTEATNALYRASNSAVAR